MKDLHAEIAALKQKSRDRDEADLASGRATAEEITHRNYIFHGIKFKINFKDAKRLW